jgi:hypothetical protein
MDRASRRRLGVDKLSAVTISFRNLAPVAWAPGRAVDSSQTYVGPGDDAVFGQALGGLLAQMGASDMSIAAAMLFKAINAHCPKDMRFMVAMGIVRGLDYRITTKEVKGEKDEVVLEVSVEGVQAYEDIIPKQPEAGVAKLVDPEGRTLI